MALRRSRKALQIIRAAYEASAEDGMKLMSIQIREGQKKALDELAAYNGISTAATIRFVVDEYMEGVLKDDSAVAYLDGES